MVGLAAACEWWWKLDWHGFGGGLAGVLGEGLKGGPARVLPLRTVVPSKGLAGGLVVFLGKDLAEDRRLLILI